MSCVTQEAFIILQFLWSGSLPGFCIAGLLWARLQLVRAAVWSRALHRWGPLPWGYTHGWLGSFTKWELSLINRKGRLTFCASIWHKGGGRNPINMHSSTGQTMRMLKRVALFEFRGWTQPASLPIPQLASGYPEWSCVEPRTWTAPSGALVMSEQTPSISYWAQACPAVSSKTPQKSSHDSKWTEGRQMLQALLEGGNGAPNHVFEEKELS